ncbi:ATP-dependent 23S rRNA helicase DbpA [hydrothermal vent metagenome]|uniref:ATP-dependent 23S rRNA helicase DbpA n=1 Tax=hydrothermal vent metagenome TaxID=652676 RepID=A0A3B0YXJ4_9ZZZZ
MNHPTFSSLSLNFALLDNIESLGYKTMTPIQAQSLPLILDGKDVIGQGKTGSGKTAAFALGLLDKLDVKNFCVQTLVLCPTRELADQVANEIRKLARTIHNIKVLTLCGGMPFGPQAASLARAAHVVVGTPGRIEDHLKRATLKLDSLNILVLDEADRMLDMGFQETLDSIIEYTPKQRQTLLFSATYPDQIQRIAKRIMINPVVVKAVVAHDDSSIQQYLFKIENTQGRFVALRLLLQHYHPESAVVFCNTKKETQEVADNLIAEGFCVVALHGDLDQRERDQALIRFANKSASILVATDVAARGLDIDALNAVINYHVAHDPEIHLHRIGRTGRAGNKGMAFTLYDEKETHKIAQFENYFDQRIEHQPLPPVSLLQKPAYQAEMTTLQIDGGKKQKLRPGDILGALTGDHGVNGKSVGKINVYGSWAYVAVSRNVVNVALNKLTSGKLKGRSFRVRRL